MPDATVTGAEETATEARRGSDPEASFDVGTADHVLTGSASFPEGFEVPPGEVWAFDPASTTVVESAANVVVLGTLVMRPSSADVEHVLRFVGIDEAAFVGGGMDPMASDVGLWVVGDGVLDLQGTPKVAWSYEWQPEWAGDDVVAAPTQPGEYRDFAAVDGPRDVPAVNDLGSASELLNLTRNVRIEGTPYGRTHVFVRSTRPQTIRYVAIRHVAPDLRDPSIRERGQDATGRYGLHFHHNGEGSRGTLVEGVVVRDAGNHAFVTHASHGVTLRDTISFDTVDAAYWWDPTTRASPGNATDDVRYERAVAALVEMTSGRGTAFQMGEGVGNAVHGSVAVGVQTGGPNNSGFGWQGTERGVWEFHDNLAHNNVAHGIFVWQNSRENHVVEQFTAYYNSKAAIAHGAYRNSYTYRDLVLLENDLARGTDTAIESIAVGRPSHDAVLRTGRHAQDPAAPVRFVDCDFSEVVVAEGPGHHSMYEFVDCGLQPDDVTVEFMHPDSLLRFQDGTTAWQMTARGTVTQIDAFA
jgi:hypothetical protein